MAVQPAEARNRSVSTRTNMTLVADGANIPVDAELSFHSSDPFAIQVVFSVASSQPVEWVFSRELLIGGVFFWRTFHDSRGTRLYGFCALGKASDLGSIWFSTEDGVVPPSYIYIEIMDRQTNTKYRSTLADTVM